MSPLTRPNWLRAKAPQGPVYARLKTMTGQYSLHTVCEEAHCPNVGECWGSGTVAFMLMGEICTRACRFCNVKSGKPDGILDNDEPAKVARAVRDLGLRYAVLTSVDRDDLPDGGASHLANTIVAIRRLTPDVCIEALIPDFGGNLTQIQAVVQANPNVIGHNLETTKPLTPQVRDSRASYDQSLKVLDHVKQINRHIFTKSSLMLGLGESEEDVFHTFRDLRAVGTDFLTLGQYLRPSQRNLPVQEFISPEQFNRYQKVAEELGFLYVASGPLVRSSYQAGEYFAHKIVNRLFEGTLERDGERLL